MMTLKTAPYRMCRVLAIAIITATAACTESELGTEYVEISEAESSLIFHGPGMKDGYRRFLKGEDAAFVKRTIGVYGPRLGNLPYAQLMLIETPPQRHFSKISRPADTVESWNFFEDKTITLGITGDTINAIGRVKYASFTADDLNCVVWTQGFDARYDRSAGSNMLAGFFCRGSTGPIMSGEAEWIVNRVDYREPTKP